MKSRFSLPSLISLIALILSAGVLPAQQLSVQVNAEKPTTLTKTDIEALPHTKLSTGAAGSEATYEAVSLKAVLEKAGVAFDKSLSGKRLASCLLVEAADGYRVVFALPELDPAFTGKQIVLAFSKDGKPLDEKEGPYRILVPDEKRMARWIRQVQTLRIVDVQ